MKSRFSPVVLVIAAFATCASARLEPAVGEIEAENANAGATGEAEPEPEATPPVTLTSAPSVPADGVTLYGIGAQAPIFSQPEWPSKDPARTADERHGVVRLGYLRRGEHVQAKKGTLARANCPEGWHELLGAGRGFVCGKFVTTDAHHKDLKFAPHLAWMDRNLPYDYGLNLTPGTPLYRRIPLKSERRDNEKTLAVGKGVKSSDIAKKMEANGEALPAYLKDSGNAKSRVGFDELKGDSELVALRMLKGFYISLDKRIDGRSGVFWHTMSGLLAPKDHLIVHQGKTEFDGVVLDAPDEKRKLPLGFIVSTKAHAIELDGSDTKSGEAIERFSILGLTGKRQRIHEHVYHETDKGFWVRDIDVAVVALPKIASDVTKGERWIDVDLGSQALVAFEGEKPVYATIVSTGRRSSDPEKDHRTVEGSFRIREKHVTTTMDDDGASDGTYRIEDVPWVMYFEKSLALHGAFWHSGFGRERSHGCVNLTPHDARHLFAWAGPALPDGWHGVKATKENPGTRVIVHK